MQIDKHASADVLLALICVLPLRMQHTFIISFLKKKNVSQIEVPYYRPASRLLSTHKYHSAVYSQSQILSLGSCMGLGMSRG